MKYMCFSMGCRWISAPLWICMCCRGAAALPWSAPQTAGESLFWCLKHLLHPLPLLLTGLGVCGAVSLTCPLSFLQLQLLLCSFFPLFLPMLFQCLYHHHWCVQPWPAVSLSWSQIALAPSDMGEASGRPSGKPLP